MKKCIGICSLAMLTMFAVILIFPSDCSAWRQKYKQELTDDPKLDEANRLYKKAIPWIKDGDNVHEAQRAAQFYDTAESYLRRAIFALKELGNKYAIDVTKEVGFCEELERNAFEARRGEEDIKITPDRRWRIRPGQI